MASFLYVLVLLGVVASSYSKNIECPVPKPMLPYDISKSLGEWVFVLGNPLHPTLKGYKCGKATVSLVPDVPTTRLKFDLSMKSKEGKLVKQISISEPIDENTPSRYIDFTQDSPIEDLKGISKSTIVDTDYTNYAVLTSCEELFDTDKNEFRKLNTAWILRRKNAELSDDLLTRLKSKLRDLGVEDSEIEKMDESDC